MEEKPSVSKDEETPTETVEPALAPVQGTGETINDDQKSQVGGSV